MNHHRNFVAVLLAAASLATGFAGTAVAAFNNDKDELSEREIQEQLDVVVSRFKKDGTAGMVFEFNPVSIPSLRCVAFSFGPAGGMQCFPRTDEPGAPR